MIDVVPFKIEFAGATDVGRARSRNEDSFRLHQELGLALVCDGMGGHAGGDVASQTASEDIIDFIYEYEPGEDGGGTEEDQDDLDETLTDTERTVTNRSEADTVVGRSISTIRAAVHRANRKLIALNLERGYPEGRGMGTTVVGVWKIESTDKLIVFHAGDSRIYRFRFGELQQLTRDHSLYQAWLDSGGHGNPPQRNIIIRALGTMKDVEPEVSLQAMVANDIFLLCSDGLTSMVSDEMIVNVLRNGQGSTLQESCETLIKLANEQGGHDNITVVLAMCLPE